MRIEHPVEFLALRSAAQLRKIFEKLLYLARGLQGGDQPSLPLPDMGPGVRYLSRPKERIPWPQLAALLADLDHVRAIGVQGRNLDVDQRPREPDLVLLPKPSSPGRYVSRMYLRAFPCH